MSTNLTIRVDKGVKKELDRLAKATGRTRAYLAQEALRQYVEQQAWQVGEIREAIKAADAGEFATSADVEKTLARWSANAR